MFTADQLHGLLCAAMYKPLLQLSRSSVLAAAFAGGAPSIPAHVLVRHAVEHVFRIRMFRPFDADATRLLNVDRPEMATIWARYARSEAVHDRYFLRDLRALQLSHNTLAGIEAFRATRNLGNFIERATRRYGALPVVLYSFWTEENSRLGSPAIIARMQAAFGISSTRGAVAHRALDNGQNHPALVRNVLADLVRNADTIIVAASLLEAITELLRTYFDELDAWSRRVPTDFSIALTVQKDGALISPAVYSAPP